MANSAAKKQGVAAHLRRLALLHGYHARTNHLAEYQPMQNRGERVALISPAPPVAPAAPGKTGCKCGGHCKKNKMLLPAAAAVNAHMRRNGKTLGDWSDFADVFGKIASGAASAISAAKGINTNPNAKTAAPAPKVAPAASPSMPSWLLPAGAAAGVVGLLVAITRR